MLTKFSGIHGVAEIEFVVLSADDLALHYQVLVTWNHLFIKAIFLVS